MFIVQENEISCPLSYPWDAVNPTVSFVSISWLDCGLLISEGKKKSSDPRSRYHRRLVFFGLQLQPKRVQTQFVKWPVITAEVMIRQQVGGGRRSVRPKLKMDETPPPPPLRRPKDTWPWKMKVWLSFPSFLWSKCTKTSQPESET